MNVKRCILAVLCLVMLLSLSTACPTPPWMFELNYIHKVNDYVHTHDNVTFHNGGEVSLPISLYVWVDNIPANAGRAPIPITKVILQYKTRRPPAAWGNTWTTVKTINNPDWDISFPKGSVILFGRNALDIPGAQVGDQFLIRVYMAAEEGLYENAPLAVDTNELGNDPVTGLPSGWTPRHVVLVNYDGRRRPQ